MSKRRKIKMSASAIGALKACPYQHYGKYVIGVRKDEVTEGQRIGSNWHEIQDVKARKPESVCVPCANLGKNDPDCPVCEGTGFLPKNMMEAVMRVLHKAYEHIPTGMDLEKIDKERTVLLYSLSGYEWCYQEDEVEVLARELKFSHRLLSSNGRALPDVVVDGIIDKLVRFRGTPAVMEHKSTTSSLDNDSSFWAHLNLDVQTTLYIDAAQQMQLNGELEPYGIKATDPLINTILYDAWHKPGISPKFISQKDSKEFVETGKYCGQEFDVNDGFSDMDDMHYVNGVVAEIKPGKKEGTFAIRETHDMYGARLLEDIVTKPDFYFARKELSKTTDEMDRFRREMLSIYYDIRNKERTNSFYHNEKQCEATYKCDYIEQCYNGIELDPDNPPDGFHCIFDKEKTDDNTSTAT